MSQVLSVFVMAVHVFRLAYMMLSVWVNRRELKRWLLVESASPAIPVPRWRNNWIMLMVQLICLGIFVVIIELFLRWNSISDVNSVASAGQIIPLVTALSGLGTVCLSRIGRDTM